MFEDITLTPEKIENKLNVLLVEDSKMDADLLVNFLQSENVEFNYTRVWDRDAFLNVLKENNFDLIIADHTMPQFTGIEAFHIVKSKKLFIPFIIVTGTVSEKMLTEYAKEGIDDYLLKDNLLRLPSAIEHVLSKKKIEQLHEKLDIAYKNIKDSIIYAKSIQHAMLPNIALLHDSFPESFILFKPKDILSGDFYWYKKIENIFFVAVADCTGHGIPGALMSMIGIEKLNTLILETKEPSVILEKLNKSIIEIMSPSSSYEHSTDGMDIALCAIDNDSNTLKFAGANRPLWIVRNKQIKVEEIKGTKKEIGGKNLDQSLNFESHEIKLQQGDTCYIFSDGFVDQVGGIINKKLKSGSFMQLLLNAQEQTMRQQEDFLNNFFEEWKAGAEQVDDMLLIGFRQK